MVLKRDEEYLRQLLEELLKLPNETGWAEFKHNNANPVEIGEYISALSNSAALSGKSFGYLVWGIDDQSHEVLGTSFKPEATKIGSEELNSWLHRLLEPGLHFSFHQLLYSDQYVVILEIARAQHRPIRFKSDEFIRVGSYKKKLRDFPEKERSLWRLFDKTSFEKQVAAEHLSGGEVLQLLDYPSFFELLNSSLPENRDSILDQLEAHRMVTRSHADHWNITNLGAILFAKKLQSFEHLSRKAVRVIKYEDNSRIKTVREQEGSKGYACGFEGLIDFINNLVPTNEIIEQALRKTVPLYPPIAVRELVANTIIHQDFSVTGAGPMVEIFSDRMEITNPGEPLIETSRFLDKPPRSRNEDLAAFLRQVGICEERGSGIDKVVFQTELFQLPAPVFEVMGDSTRVLLFSHRPLSKMDKDDRTRACYLHSCLKFVNREKMTNSTVRNRFGIEKHNSAMASRIIAETVDASLIRPYDPKMSKKYASYIPFWA